MKKIIINLDWDETITSEDTTSLISIINQTKTKAKEKEFQKYIEEYDILIQRYENEFKRIKNDLREEIEFLNGFKEIENRMINQIEHDEYFKNSNHDDDDEGNLEKENERVYEKVRFKKGWNEFFNWFNEIQSNEIKLNLQIQLNILSCSWSSQFIQNSLNFHQYSSLKFTSIRSNEINRSNGTLMISEDCKVIKDGMKTALDKLFEFQNILSSQKDYQSIYIGDSLNDLMCFLSSNLAIVLGRNAKLLQTFDRLEIDLIELDEFIALQSDQVQVQVQNLIVRVDDWYEVLKVLNKFLGY